MGLGFCLRGSTCVHLMQLCLVHLLLNTTIIRLKHLGIRLLVIFMAIYSYSAQHFWPRTCTIYFIARQHAVVRCPLVFCLSMPALCLNQSIVKVFNGLVGDSILVFLRAHRRYKIPRGTLCGSVKYPEVGKFGKSPHPEN